MLKVLDTPEDKMTPEQFIYWLQGFFEITGTNKLTEKQVQIIKDHLKQVFKKETPDRTETSDFIPKEPGTTDPTIPNEHITFIC